MDGAMTIKQAIKAIQKREKALAAERDRLNDLIAELESLRDVCEDAMDSLKVAASSLSQVV